ncbi:MAG: hypothetical protein JWN03_8665 [Nocardia sp.]|uniref:hypothetical protein n=1 Tax=Nocardia sp. TaxID=1821 RepID=UPI002634E4C5|nr:hypothetical protein [Nocardia sp.]MCU1648390.1 hypothetical protein [Nocardia sp.]
MPAHRLLNHARTTAAAFALAGAFVILPATLAPALANASSNTSGNGAPSNGFTFGNGPARNGYTFGNGPLSNGFSSVGPSGAGNIEPLGPNVPDNQPNYSSHCDLHPAPHTAYAVRC